MSGLGTQTASGTGSNTANTSSQTAPWAPAQSDLTAQLANAGALTGYGAINKNSQNMWLGGAPTTGNRFNNADPNSAMGVAESLGNPGVAANKIGTNFETGDPQNLLRSSLSNYTGNIAPIANQNVDPSQNPQMQAMIQSLNDQITQSVNSQFAGAGRTNSGMNSKALAMGLSEGEAPTLLNQYNQNVANKMNANQGILGGSQNAQALENANQQAGVQMQSSAFPLSQLPFQTTQQAWNAPALNAGQLAGMDENLTVPIAGLGGQTIGTGSGTNQTAQTQTASPLTQLAQFGGLFGNLV